jgi:hypothetical protein
MTSFGIEWETNILVAFKSNKLPEHVIEKASISMDDKWGITFEGFNSNKYRDDLYKKDINDNTDCGYGIEMNMGVFRSKFKNSFNMTELDDVADNINDYLINLMKTAEISIYNTNYNVVSFVTKKMNDSSRDDLYSDCMLTNRVDWQNKDREVSELLFLKNPSRYYGRPQLTVGFDILYVANLFRLIIKRMNDLKYENYDEYNTGVGRTNLIHIEPIYMITISQYLFMSNYTHIGFNVDMSMLFSFMLLVNYNLYIINYPVKGAKYLKAKFPFKLRTNLACIKRDLSTHTKLYADQWLEQMKSQKFINLKDKTSDFDHIEFLESLIQNKFNDAYRFIIPKDCILSTQLSPLGIYHININDKQKMITSGITLVDVPHFSFSNRKNAAEIIINNQNNIVYKNASEIVQNDFGEWDFIGNIVHIEARGVSRLYNLFKPSYVESMKDTVTILEMMKVEIRLCIDKIFNPSLNEDVDEPMYSYILAIGDKVKMDFFHNTFTGYPSIFSITNNIDTDTDTDTDVDNFF